MQLLGQTSDQLQLFLGPLALTAFLLVAVVYGGIKRWWVFGWIYEVKAKECEEWKELAKTGTVAAERGTRVAEAAVSNTTPEGGTR
jgi:hypothetical protein